MRRVYVATLQVAVEVSDEAEACDAMSSILTAVEQRFQPRSCLVDWQYVSARWAPTETADVKDYKEGEVFRGVATPLIVVLQPQDPLTAPEGRT